MTRPRVYTASLIRESGWYVARCRERSVVAQGRDPALAFGHLVVAMAADAFVDIPFRLVADDKRFETVCHVRPNAYKGDNEPAPDDEEG